MSRKPWARIEVGYLDHPKFQALNANAICLWHEGKQYCDRFHTDGLIPRDVVKRFRFSGKKSIDLLLAPIELPKPDGSTYAPLWEAHSVGYKMHDYLDHNDCRDEILARIEDANDARELRKIANRERQARFRAERKNQLHVAKQAETRGSRNAGVTPVTRDRNALVTPVTPTPTDTDTDTETSTKNGSVEPLRDSSPAVLSFPVVGDPKQPIWALTQGQLAQWAQAYPNLDILAECRKALAWLAANPAKRKTARGMGAFLVNWFNRATDRGGSAQSIRPAPVAAEVRATMSPAAAALLKERQSA
jgi:hypothetical protein